MRPARPPPTTTMRSLDEAIDSLHPKRGDGAHSNHRQDEEDRRGYEHHAALRPRSDRQTPDDRKRPDSVGEVEGGREDARHVEREDPGIRHGRLNLPEQIEALVILQL